RWLLMMHDRAEGGALAYTHEFLANILGANRKSVTLAAQSMQNAGLISYRRGTIQVLSSCGMSALCQERTKRKKTSGGGLTRTDQCRSTQQLRLLR
ncbi:MAG: helix-turn-helix domain-containing protein, partial [Pseudolabrys sp.]